MESRPTKVNCSTIRNLVADLPVIGSGNFSTVYKLDNEKILKVVNSGLHTFSQELKIMETLNETNVTPYMYHGGICLDTGFVVMEYLHGDTFSNYVNQFSFLGYIPPDFLTWFIPLLLEKLRIMHSCGIQHNDLHGDNIFITMKNGFPHNVYIIDVGQASEYTDNNEDFNYFATTLINVFNVPIDLLENLSGQKIEMVDD